MKGVAFVRAWPKRMFTLSLCPSIRYCSMFLRRNISLSSINTVRNHYEVLDVPRNASRMDIKSAFVKLSKQHHPDVSKDDSGAFIEISEAYNTLVDPFRRSSYDRELHTIETYMDRVKHSQYSGSHGYSSNQKWPYSSTSGGYQGYYSNVDYVDTNIRFSMKRRNHSRVVGYLVALMVLVTGLHSFRINKTHKEFQRISEEESRKNHLVYSRVRETAKSRTIEQQLATLATKHSEGLDRLSKAKN